MQPFLAEVLDVNQIGRHHHNETCEVVEVKRRSLGERLLQHYQILQISVAGVTHLKGREDRKTPFFRDGLDVIGKDGMDGLVLKFNFIFFWLDFFTFMVFLLLGNAVISSVKVRKDEEGKQMRSDSSKGPGQFMERKEDQNNAKGGGILPDQQVVQRQDQKVAPKIILCNNIKDYMDSRLQQLVQKQLSKPRKFAELKQDPFPYLAQSNRQEIFEFIVQIQAQNSNLTAKLAEKHPHRTLQQCFEQHRALQAKRSLIQINLESIQKMDIEIKEKMEQTEQMRARNLELQRISQELAQSFELIESDLIEVQKEKRFLEMKLKLQQERDSKAVDLSLILQNLYHEVKDTLNQPL